MLLLQAPFGLFYLGGRIKYLYKGVLQHTLMHQVVSSILFFQLMEVKLILESTVAKLYI